jgi:Leucine-rich repeat (LRR) protein
MIRNRHHVLFFSCLFFVLYSANAQDIGGYNKNEIKDLSQKAQDQITFLEYFLNTLGSSETPARDKDVIIRESYKKIFRDGKVQVEDDLLLDRKVITNKDVPAYLKDIEFFFKEAAFKFKIREVKPFLRDNGELSFLVSMDRTLTATGLNKEKITNTKPRFVEINVDKKSNELKIASIYTTKLSRDQELQDWWKGLSYTWTSYLKESIGLMEEDSVTLDHLYKIAAIEKIDFSGNEYVQDLAAIEALRDLKEIDISNTKILDLKPISNVTFLTRLNISNTPTEDIQFIKYSDRLEHLDISGTQIKDIAELENLKSLKSLRIVGTPVESYEVLNAYSTLTALDVSNSTFTNLENINALSNLEKLDLSGNYLTNFDQISSLTNLTELNLQSTNVTDLSPVAALPKLAWINFNQTGVTSLSALNNKPALRNVYADGTGVSEAEAEEYSRTNRSVLLIHHTESLHSWWESLPQEWKNALIAIDSRLNVPNPTVETLASMVTRDSLDVSDSKIISLNPILKFRMLQDLRFDNTEVSDLAPLSELKTLVTVSGKGTKVKTLEPLANLGGIKRLNFEGAPINSFLSLTSLSNLAYLNMDKSEIRQSDIPQFLIASPEVNIVFRSDSLMAWWSNLDDAWKGVFKSQFGKGEAEPNSETLHIWTAKPELSINGASINNLMPLAIMVNLRRLSVDNVSMSDISHVSELQLLEILKISHAPVVDFTALPALRELKSLDLSYTGISDLRVLATMSSLESLTLTGNNIKVLRGLEGMFNLSHLDIAGTNVSSLKPVQGLQIKRLVCFNSGLKQKAVDAFKKLNPDCEVRFY